MKAPARLHGAAPPVHAQPPIAAHRWRRLLLPAIGIVVAVLALAAAMAWLDHAEGDLRQVRAPTTEPSATTPTAPAFQPSATRVS
jgi:ferric-dicitrate binding protein FerR (iron transport regulator)